MKSAKDNGNLAGDLQGKMQRLSRRDLQLWLIALLVLLVIVSGVVALALPNLSWNGASLKVEARYLPQVLFGLIGIVILFNLYVLQQRRELNQAREDLMGQWLQQQRDDDSVMVDSLTQLFNRRFLEHVLPKEAHRAKRQGSSLSLLMVSVEDLPAIAQRRGSSAGNQCLLEVARLMESTFRLSDTVVRYGNDRFLVLMPDTLEAQAEVALERLLSAVAARNEKSAAHYPMALSCGISSFEEGADISDVLHIAEQSLSQQRKQRRREQVLRADACPQALLVCSNPEVLGMLRPVLDSLEIGVDLCTDPEEGVRALDGRRLDALLLDCGEQDRHVEMLQRIRQTTRGRRLLVLAIVSQAGAEAAYRLGANFVLTRPLGVEAVTNSLRVVHGMMVGEEQRFFRHAVETTVHMNFGQVLLEASVSHLSEGGMVVRATSPLEANRTATLRFKLPNLAQPLEAQGETAWVSPDGRAGIRFVHVPMASRRLIQRWLGDASRGGETRISAPAVEQGAGNGGVQEVARQAMLVPSVSWGTS